MGSKYEVILTLIQQKPELSSFVVNFMVQGKLAKRRIVKFSSLVLEHLEGKNEDKSDELDLFDESMDESSHGTKKLGKYAREIKKLYVG
jgi:hypothetical protein